MRGRVGGVPPVSDCFQATPTFVSLRMGLPGPLPIPQMANPQPVPGSSCPSLPMASSPNRSRTISCPLMKLRYFGPSSIRLVNCSNWRKPLATSRVVQLELFLWRACHACSHAGRARNLICSPVGSDLQTRCRLSQNIGTSCVPASGHMLWLFRGLCIFPFDGFQPSPFGPMQSELPLV